MPRRIRHPEEPESHERWLVSYADFITLLFAFFVTMYALSSVNEGKYRVLSDSLVQAFRNVPANASGTKIAPRMSVPRISAPMVPLAGSLQKASNVPKEQRRVLRAKMRNMAQAIAEALAPLVREGQVRVTETSRGVTVEINASVLFDSGDAQLDPRAVAALQAVAQILAPTEFPIVVEGHTDNTPISTAQFPSNWELSVVRAARVVRLFIDAGVAPQRVTASGYGDQRPVADNDSPEGRARNRRVSVLIDSPNDDIPEEIPIAPDGGAATAARLPAAKLAG
jgi:chemotaxis protein MotB